MNAAPKLFGASRAWSRKYFRYCKISKKNFREFGVSCAGNGCFCLPACENMGRKGRGINFSLGALRLSQNSTPYIFSFPFFFCETKVNLRRSRKGKEEEGKKKKNHFFRPRLFPFLRAIWRYIKITKKVKRKEFEGRGRRRRKSFHLSKGELCNTVLLSTLANQR